MLSLGAVLSAKVRAHHAELRGRSAGGAFARSSRERRLAQSPPLGALRDDGSVDPAHAAAMSDELAIALYEHMVLARALDERLVALQRDGAIASHSSAVGEEAAIVGAVAAMHDDDWIFPGSREFAAALWRGMPLAAYAHHVFGTARDAAHGRNAPDPPFWKAARVASVSPLVGHAHPARGRRGVGGAHPKADVASLVFFGEGATSSGDFHTGLNFAGVTRAPVVALCRNNGWATSTPASRQTASGGFAIKAVAYGLRGVRVDGVRRRRRPQRRARRAGARRGRPGRDARRGGHPRSATRVDPVARMRRHLEARGALGRRRARRASRPRSAPTSSAPSPRPPRRAKPARETIFDDVYAELPGTWDEQKDDAR